MVQGSTANVGDGFGQIAVLEVVDQGNASLHQLERGVECGKVVDVLGR